MLTMISSMATRELLLRLNAEFAKSNLPDACQIQLTAIGGVDAAKRIRAGDAFDIVVLADNVIGQLVGEGLLLQDTRADLAVSKIVVGVKAGSSLPNLRSADEVKAAVLSSRTIGYSTGPSGVYLEELFKSWGIWESIESKIVQAKPGVPVAALVARGEVELGFQQLSEMQGVAGVQLAGLLPTSIQKPTTFSAGIVSSSTKVASAQALFSFWNSQAARAIVTEFGMESPKTE